MCLFGICIVPINDWDPKIIFILEVNYIEFIVKGNDIHF